MQGNFFDGVIKIPSETSSGGRMPPFDVCHLFGLIDKPSVIALGCVCKCSVESTIVVAVKGLFVIKCIYTRCFYSSNFLFPKTFSSLLSVSGSNFEMTI